MPDGDNVCLELPVKYRKQYQGVCEGSIGEERISHNLLKPLKEDIEEVSIGDVIVLIKKIAARFEQIAIDLRFNNPINWEKETLLIEQVMRHTNMKKQARNHLMAACKEQLQDIRHGGLDLHMAIEITKKYMLKIYECQFESKVLSTQRHHADAEPAFVQERIRLIRDCVWSSLSDFAQQAIKNGHFGNLRRPRRRKQSLSESDLYRDITELLD